MADPFSDPPDELRPGAQPQLRLAFDIALWRQQEQRERDRTLDSRLGYAFGLSAAMIALFGTASLFVDRSDISEIGEIVAAAAALFITNIVISAIAFVIGRWTLAPNLPELLRYAETTDEDELLRWATDALKQAIAHNERWLWLKGWLVSLAVVLTAATAVTIAVATIVAVG